MTAPIAAATAATIIGTLSPVASDIFIVSCLSGMPKDPLDILPVRMPEREDCGVDPRLPDIVTGSLVLDCRPVKSGKSVTLMNVLKRFYKDQFETIYLFSPTCAAGSDLTTRALLDDPKTVLFETYTDEALQSILDHQRSFGRGKAPRIFLGFDDPIQQGIPMNALCNRLGASFRHWLGGGLMWYSTQVLKSAAVTIRANCTHLIVGRTASGKELEKLTDEFSHRFGGPRNLERLLNHATANSKYDFLYLKLHETPAQAYKNFTDLIWEGDSK